MAVNAFINAMLAKLSVPFPRLAEPVTQLHILTEMMSQKVFSLVHHILQLEPEYRRQWQLIDARQNTIINIELAELPQFQELQRYMRKRGLLSQYELEWLDDAIHEVLTS